MTSLIALIRYLALTASITAAMTTIQPATNHDALAAQIASVAIWHPLFDDDDGTLTAAQLRAGAFEESSFNPSAVGKAGEIGLFQIWKGGERMKDPIANAIAGVNQMRISFADSPRYPWAEFLGGPKGIESARVRRLSSRREALAARILGFMNGPDLSRAEARK